MAVVAEEMAQWLEYKTWIPLTVHMHISALASFSLLKSVDL